jgi:hypothetical protein
MKRSTSCEGSLMTMLDQERNYRFHKNRLYDISADKKAIEKNIKSISNHHDVVTRHQQNTRRTKSYKLLEIQKENDRMFQKLINIAFKLEKKVSQSPKKLSNSSLFTEGKPTTLNKVQRELDRKRIQLENDRLAERIIYQGSQLSPNKLEVDYQKQVALKQRIQKFKVDPDSQVIIGHSGAKFDKQMRLQSQKKYLPPIKSANSSMISMAPIRSSSVDPYKSSHSRESGEKHIVRNRVNQTEKKPNKNLEDDYEEQVQDFGEEDNRLKSHQPQEKTLKQEETEQLLKPISKTLENKPTHNIQDQPKNLPTHNVQDQPKNQPIHNVQEQPKNQPTKIENDNEIEYSASFDKSQQKIESSPNKQHLSPKKDETENKDKNSEAIKTEEDFNGSYQDKFD